MKEYALENDKLLVKFLDFGGSFTYFGLKSDGINCVANFKDKNDYLKISDPYLNALVGPFAGRIKEGKCDGFNFSVNGGHHLHGGNLGVSKQYFSVCQNNPTSATLTLTVNHSDDGYPGCVDYTVNYLLEDDVLIIDYYAVPSNKQPLNMTTHLYFNLSGSASEGVRNHVLHIPTSKRCPIAVSGVPESVEKIEKGCAFDFDDSRTIGQHFDMKPREFDVTRGFDCPYVLEKSVLELEYEPLNKKLVIETDATSVVVYTANYFDESMIMDNGECCGMLSYVALECQDIPNGMNFDPQVTFYHDHNNPYKQHSVYHLTSIK